MGDRAWLAFFVRPNKSAVVRYPSADEVEQYKASLATQSAQQTAKYALLEDHLRLQLDAVGTEYTTGLVPGIIRELLSHGEKRAHQEAALTERKVVGSRRLIFDTLGPSNPQILSQHCIGDTAHRVLQLTVHRQMKNPSCGYFAIYNSLTCAEIALAPDDATATSLLENLSSPFAFWQRYWQMVQCLLFECDRQGRGCYPWSRQSVESRTLEREYAQFLVEKWPPLQHFGGTVDFVSVPECHSVFTGGASLEAFQAIQARVQRLREQDNVCTAFLLGTVMHWVALFVNKVNGQFEFVLMDSLNKTLLGASEADLWEIVQEGYRYRISQGKSLTEVEQLLYFQQMQDIQASTDLIVKWVTTDSNMLAAWVEGGVDTILNGFEEQVVSPLLAQHQALGSSEADPFENGYPAELVAEWLAGGSQTSAVEESILERCELVSFSSLSERNQQRLREWHRLLELTTCSDLFQILRVGDGAFLERFAETVAQLGVLVSGRAV
eukprot:m.542959 g.542959  ORF g.542959 m.542959 type:complete len:495 (-) comp57666_c0_seq1:36-1520(-)